ncbi:MAG: hypothetical protein GX382_10000 [Syntrophomonadaceae bacterium]|jgi:hypothetical protein|nr:hypothetical protein [Syntrophomonadaceae bacterium]
MSTLVEESDIVGEDGRAKGRRGTGCPKRATKQDVLFSPVPLESHIKPLLYRDDGTGAHGEPTGYYILLRDDT